MPQIQQLPPHLADLIAAGEVVERPASVCKELLENALDAGASAISTELERGGLTYIRITDNGCGIAPEQLPTAFLRHATSKLRRPEDLAAIGTLGFRGEALAAIAAVSRVDIFSRQTGADCGAMLHLEGGVPEAVTEAGCPDGTTVCIRDLFYNTPARMKFMKKDTAEGAAAAGVVTHLALSHPDVSFKLLRDGQEILHTPGDGQLLSAIYAALGRDFANSLLPVSGSGGAVRVDGFITKPLAGHGTRGRQLFFVNGRFVKSQLLAAAVEEAYRNRLLKGRFPGCVLHITLPVNEVDVNVHPAKTVVKFLSDKTVFDAVHYTVKDALDREGQPAPAEKKPFYQTMTAREFRETAPAPQGVKLPFVSGRPVGSAGAGSPTVNRFAPAAPTVQTPRETVQPAAAPQGDVWQVQDAAPEAGKAFTVPSGREGVVYRITPPDAPEDSPAHEQAAAETETVPAAAMPEAAGSNDTTLSAPEAAPIQQELEMPETADSGETPWRIAGEVLKTYIICEDGEQNVWLIDKHAAHERIRFDALKADPVPPMAQQLLTPAAVTLTAEEYGAVLESLDVLAGYGFLCEDFGDGAVLVREIPDYIRAEDAAATLEELARKLLLQRADPAGARDELLHTMACKSAIKAGMTTDAAELAALVRQVQSGAVRYCPHGRPVAVQLRKYEVEKMFKRA
jgi:DNA mismatch repair protein MutL